MPDYCYGAIILKGLQIIESESFKTKFLSKAECPDFGWNGVNFFLSSWCSAMFLI